MRVGGKRRLNPALLPIVAFAGLLVALGVYQAANAAYIQSVGEYLLQWGSYGYEQGQFGFPRGIAVDSDEQVYVADMFNSRVQKFDGNGGFLRMWGYGVNTNGEIFEICTSGTTPCYRGKLGSGTGQFAQPVGIAVDASGNVYVSDQVNDRIYKFDGDGNWLDEWGSEGDGAGEIENPQALTVDGAGAIYVADLANHRVQKFDSDGDFSLMWGYGVDTGNKEFEICTSTTIPCQAGRSDGTGEGQFHSPMGIAVTGDGYVYVADAFFNRIQVFTTDGLYKSMWGSSGTGAGEFDGVHGVATNRFGAVFAADTWQDRVQQFENVDHFNDFIRMWGWGVDTGANASEICTGATPCLDGTAGDGDGQFRSPYDLAVGRCGGVYVADTWNHRIQKFLGGYCAYLPVIVK